MRSFWLLPRIHKPVVPLLFWHLGRPSFNLYPFSALVLHVAAPISTFLVIDTLDTAPDSGLTDRASAPERSFLRDDGFYHLSPSRVTLAGHSHWANIKHQKAKKDIEKGKTFGRIASLIKTAVKVGGTDPNSNSLLSQHLETARKMGFPKEKIAHAMAAGSGKDDTERIIYEGRGPDKIVMMVIVDTDNKFVRSAFTKNGGILGSPGSASFIFSKEGVLNFADPFGGSQEKVFDVMLEAGEDIKSFELVGDTIEVIVDPSALASAKESLSKLGLEKCTKAEIIYKPQSSVKLEDPTDLLKLVSVLEEIDDVVDVVHNASWDE